jgi:shikimate dehydrogenase
MAEKKDKIFGLLGKNISYSFSKGYFTEKFNKLHLNDNEYVNFDIPTIQNLPETIQKTTNIKGMNVTIPYKVEVIPFLDDLDDTAKKIGAVNTIKFTEKGTLKGYNTDVVGFENSIKPFFKSHHQKALILGTGGASKAVAYALTKNNISYKFVSRTPTEENQISYDAITEELLNEYHIIINCTPLGTSPNTEKCPSIPYQYINKKHLMYDLIYNPAVTTFLQKGLDNGATIKNGLEMLELQAEESWRIWNAS